MFVLCGHNSNLGAIFLRKKMFEHSRARYGGYAWTG